MRHIKKELDTQDAELSKEFCDIIRKMMRSPEKAIFKSAVPLKEYLDNLKSEQKSKLGRIIKKLSTFQDTICISISIQNDVQNSSPILQFMDKIGDITLSNIQELNNHFLFSGY